MQEKFIEEFAVLLDSDNYPKVPDAWQSGQLMDRGDGVVNRIVSLGKKTLFRKDLTPDYDFIDEVVQTYGDVVSVNPGSIGWRIRLVTTKGSIQILGI